MNKIVLSGAQPSGNFHLGNYLGALKKWVELQNSYECLYFLADYHTITVDIDKSEFSASVFNTVACYLAAGLDPEKSTIFLQSHLKEHAELAWILNCVTPIGWLKRMTQFKDKAKSGEEKASLGLFSYPVLMAADIVMYDANFVPVGEDQKQHLEFTRDIVGVINRKFEKEILTVPEPLISGPSVRVMSLKDGTKKMSKSDPSDYSRINLNDDKDSIKQKFMKSKTDNIEKIYFDEKNRPEVSNLLNIYASLTGKNISEIENMYANSGFAKFKSELADITIDSILPIKTKFDELIKDKDYLLEILRSGSAKAKPKAKATLARVKEAFGFTTP